MLYGESFHQSAYRRKANENKHGNLDNNQTMLANKPETIQKLKEIQINLPFETENLTLKSKIKMESIVKQKVIEPKLKPNFI